MTQYLLSIDQPEGGPPPREVLAKVMRDVNALSQEMKAAGAWVFAGGLHAPSTPPWCSWRMATCSRLTDRRVPRAAGTSHTASPGRSRPSSVCVHLWAVTRALRPTSKSRRPQG